MVCLRLWWLVDGMVALLLKHEAARDNEDGTNCCIRWTATDNQQNGGKEQQ